MLKPKTAATDFSTELYRGNYDFILAATIDQGKTKFSPAKLWIVIGALCFKGRIREAEILFADHDGKLKVTERIQCRFFLGISRTRVGHYELGRQYLLANLREIKRRRPKSDPLAQFYIHQGVAFYRYFSGKLGAADRSSKLAFAAALRAGNLYGRVLASDVRGHILIQLGEVREGIDILKRAAKLAGQLGNGSMPSSVNLAVTVYEAQYGIEAKTSIATLENHLANLKVQDSYSESTLLLELVRQQILRAQLTRARAYLDRAAQVIYTSQNRRHEILLNLRYGYLAFSTGEPALALNFLRAGKKTLDRRVDQMFELELLGMEHQLLTALGMSDGVPALEAQIKNKSRVFGGGINQRILARGRGQVSREFRRNLDPLGDIISDLAVKTLPENHDENLEQVLSSGFYHLLYKILDVPRSGTFLYLDLQPGTLTVFSKGNVVHHSGLTPLLRKLFLEISQQSCSKAHLIKQLWNYDYHPLRHDAVIYSAVTSARKLLGDYASWLVTTETGYQLTGEIQFRVYSPLHSQPSRARETTLSASVTPNEETGMDRQLNLRQLKILRYLRAHQTVGVRQIVELFKVSDITASRDLAGLNAAAKVVRLGRGRATVYGLPDTDFGQV